MLTQCEALRACHVGATIATASLMFLALLCEFFLVCNIASCLDMFVVFICCFVAYDQFCILVTRDLFLTTFMMSQMFSLPTYWILFGFNAIVTALCY